MTGANVKEAPLSEIREVAVGYLGLLVERLTEFVAIPSVSSDVQAMPAMEEAAQWVAAEASGWGAASTQVVPTAGAPLVLARFPSPTPEARRVVVYCHYDVQPADPVSAWDSPPFELTSRDGHLYGRGAADDKGPILAHLAALRAWNEVQGGPPVEVVLLLDGEEESGSPNLASGLNEVIDQLGTDLLVVSDTSILGEGRPSLCYGFRGTCALELEVRTADRDLHSGRYGGVAPNAVHELARLVATLHDEEGNVAVPGLLAAIDPIDETEFQRLLSVDLTEEDLLDGTGVRAAIGGSDRSVAERAWAGAAIDVNGITGGHTGPGTKTIIPAVAAAKLSARLVPGQEPQAMAAAIELHLREHAPGYVNLNVTFVHGGPSLLTSPDDPDAQAALDAYRHGYGAEPGLNREGGSVPVVPAIANALGATPLLLGFGLPDQAEHAPNERLSEANLECAVRTLATFWGCVPQQRPTAFLPQAVGSLGAEGAEEQYR